MFLSNPWSTIDTIVVLLEQCALLSLERDAKRDAKLEDEEIEQSLATFTTHACRGKVAD